MFERKKYSFATYFLLLVIIWVTIPWFYRFILHIVLGGSYGYISDKAGIFGYLVFPVIFPILYVSAFIGIVLRKVFGNVLIIISSIINIVILFLFYSNETLITGIINSIVMIILGYYDFKKVKSFTIKK